MPSLVRRHRLEPIGYGKARRYPRKTAEALSALRSRGRSINTSNLYCDRLRNSPSTERSICRVRLAD